MNGNWLGDLWNDLKVVVADGKSWFDDVFHRDENENPNPATPQASATFWSKYKQPIIIGGVLLTIVSIFYFGRSK